MAKQQTMNFKNQNKLVDLFKKIAKQSNQDSKIAKHYYCTVTKIYNDVYADVELSQGSATTTFSHMVNKSGVILSIGDLVLLTAPMGDLSDMYIDKNQNTNVQTSANNIVGTLIIGGTNNSNGLIQIMESGYDNPAMEISGYSIDFYDFQQSGSEIGSIVTDIDVDSSGNRTGTPSLSIIAEQVCSTKLGLRNLDGTTFDGLIVNNNATNACRNIDINLPLNIYPSGVSGSGLQVTTLGTDIFGYTHHEGGDVTGIGSLECVNLAVTGTKNCVQDTKNFGKRLFYSMEYGDNQIGEHGFGNIINGECVVSIDSIVLESINTDMAYTVRYDFDEDCTHKLTKNPLYFVLTANKDIGFSWSIMGFRRGFEGENLEYADNLKNDLIQSNERNVLIDDLCSENADLLSNSLLDI